MAETTLAAILPRGAVAVERGTIDGRDRPSPPGELPELYPVEEELIAGASVGRRREFAEARACARDALAALGVPAGPIPAAGDGAPIWPEGVVGSVTHKGGYRAAAVARVADLAGLGIDAEPDERLPGGVLETIASPEELDQVEALLAGQAGVAWDRLLFCAKEAVVKTVYPLGVRPAGVRSVEIAIGGARVFRACATDQGFDIGGAWVVRNSVLVTVAWTASAVS
jgi:4'-phosphopantetheinyl transferase EntD